MHDGSGLLEEEVEASPQDQPAMLSRGEGQIRPRARLLRTIGSELISSEQVAILELVRNCYDADARRVELRFTNPHLLQQATLEIRDDGHGMSREILLGPWLEPATDHKASTGQGGAAGLYSPKGRRRLGSKGVGRFAAQRLGRQLRLCTRTIRAHNELIAEFDWTKLDHAEGYLDELRIPWYERKPQAIANTGGTSLLISELVDDWRPERFDRLRIALARLVSPTRQTDGFSIHLVINGSSEEIRPALDTDRAMYSLEGEVLAGGVCKMHYTDLSGAKERWDRRVVWHEEGQVCGPFRFRINVWDLDREPLKVFLDKSDNQLGLRDFRRLVRDHSGISLYRDGFRILPYGEPDNDWLRLDRRRVNNPTMRFSNNQILGWLQLTAEGNPMLKDQTNREGLVDNGSYTHLQEVVLELLEHLEGRRFSARRQLGIVWTKRSHLLPTPAEDDSALEKALQRLETPQGGEKVKKSIKEVRTILQDRQRAVTETVNHYASLATAGQMSGLVFSQLEHPISRIRSELKTSLADLDVGGLEEEDLADIGHRLRTALGQLEAMELRMRRLDPLAIGRKAQKPMKVKLKDCFEPVLQAFQERLDATRITVEQGGLVDEEVEASPTMMQQVLANLLDNAIYWLGQHNGARLIRLTFGQKSFVLENTGPSIPTDELSNIFEPHFTTRPDASGMGLTLVRDLLLTSGGRIEVANLPQGQQGVSFRVFLN